MTLNSVADRSRPVDFPDFTQGRWKTTHPIKLMGDATVHKHSAAILAEDRPLRHRERPSFR